MTKKILIIEDDRAVSELLRHILKGSRYDVTCEHDGLAGLERAAALQPDLVILDVNLPKLDGWQVLDALKVSEKTKSIPVIMCTEHSQIGEIEQAGEMGAVNYIIKPFHTDRVLKKVEEVLRQR